MLALYRGGRQAEALEVFDRGRRRLDEELGLEPGPALRGLQQRILDQDPGSPRRHADRHRARGAAAAAARSSSAAVAAALAAGTVAVVVSGADDAPVAAPAGEGQLALLDAGSGKLTRRIAIGTTPQVVAAGAGRSGWSMPTSRR